MDKIRKISYNKSYTEERVSFSSGLVYRIRHIGNGFELKYEIKR